MMEGFISSVVIVCVFALGWVASANTIAVECDRLGSFYVGKIVYKCESKATGEQP